MGRAHPNEMNQLIIEGVKNVRPFVEHGAFGAYAHGCIGDLPCRTC